MRVLLPLALLSLLAAGCVQSPGQPKDGTGADLPTGTTWAAAALAYGEGHDHTDPKQHANMTTPNFEELGWDPLETVYHGKTSGGYLCGEAATTTEGRRLAVVSSFTTDIAFVVVDVTDAMHPSKVGEFALKGVKSYDVTMTPDGLHVAVAADSVGNNEDPRLSGLGLGVAAPAFMEMTYRDACTGVERVVMGPEEQVPLKPGVVLVGIQDPTKPTFEDFAATPFLGPHSVTAAKDGDAVYVVASITNLAHAGSYFSFYQVTGTPLGSKLVLLSTVDAQQYGEVLSKPQEAVGNGHVDAMLFRHPGTNKLVAYLCDWDGGLVVLDMSNPRAPVKLGQWADKQVEGGAMHSAFPLPDLRDGRHYVLAGQEFLHRPVDRPTGWIYILDDTDPAKVEEVGRWTLPADTEPDWGNNELFSTHYFAEHNGTGFVTMYHGGVWAIDLSTPEKMANPPTIGVFMPHNEPPNPPKVDWKGQIRSWPYVLDVIPYPDGTLVTFDSTSGAYTVRFDPTKPMTPPTPWPKEGTEHEDNG